MRVRVTVPFAAVTHTWPRLAVPSKNWTKPVRWSPGGPTVAVSLTVLPLAVAVSQVVLVASVGVNPPQVSWNGPIPLSE